MARRANLLMSVLASALLAGCSFMPDHATDLTAAPAQWPAEVWVARAEDGTAERLPLDATSDESWRRFFTEPEAQQVIAAALTGNRDLVRSLARVEEAQAQAGQVRSGLWPSLDLQVQRQAVHTPGTALSGNSSNAGTHVRYDVGLVTSYEIDFWGRVRSYDTATRATYLATEEAHRSFRIALIADTANAWYALEDHRLREHLLSRVELARKASLDLVEQRRDVGLAGELDVTTARAAYHATRTERLNTARLRVHAENALRLFVGRELDPAWLRPLPDAGTMPPLPIFPQVAVGLPAEALLRRPDVHAAEQRLLAARANIGVARAAFLPRITLTASGGTASRALADLFTAGSGAWAFTPVLLQPLFDAGRRSAELDIARAREHAAVAEYELAVQRAFREIADVLATSHYGWRAVNAVYDVAQAQEARLKLVEARHVAGVSNYLELLDAQRDALAAQQNQSSARYAVQNSATLFFKAVGGI